MKYTVLYVDDCTPKQKTFNSKKKALGFLDQYAIQNSGIPCSISNRVYKNVNFSYTSLMYIGSTYLGLPFYLGQGVPKCNIFTIL